MAAYTLRLRQPRSDAYAGLRIINKQGDVHLYQYGVLRNNDYYG